MPQEGQGHPSCIKNRGLDSRQDILVLEIESVSANAAGPEQQLVLCAV